MDSNKINYNEEVLKGGLIIAGVSILVTMVTYIVNVELMGAWWFGLLALAISISSFIKNKYLSLKVTISSAIAEAFVIPINGLA